MTFPSDTRDRILEDLAQPSLRTCDPRVAAHIADLCIISPPMLSSLRAHPDWLPWLINQAGTLAAGSDNEWDRLWSGRPDPVAPGAPGFPDQLRAFKRREYLRIALADTAGYWTFGTTVRSLSGLADFVIAASLSHSRITLEAEAATGSGARPPGGFSVFALGKLGGVELNYSSDVDLVFCRESSDAPEDLRFFTRLGERLVQVLSRPGPDGFLFRVDMRLRPHGESGPLVPTIDSMVNYYESWGEAWERQALIKARQVAGDEVLGRRFIDFAGSYAFARQMDDWALEEVKRVKYRSEREHAAAGGRVNVKQGPGGIRDIEFYTQYHQLIAGSRFSGARSGSTLDALQGLAEARVLLEGELTQLSLAYLLLRTVEHRLQLKSLTPEPLIPVAGTEADLLAAGLGFGRAGRPPAQALDAVLDDHRARVRKILERIYLTPGYLRLTEREEEFAQLLSERTPKARVRELLTGYGFQDVDKAWQNIRLLALGPEGRHLPPAERRVFLEFVFPLLEVLRDSIDPDLALHHLEGFAASSGNRISFLRTLASRRPHLARLTNLLAYSRLSDRILSRHPEFFDSLARGIHLHEGRTMGEMSQELRERFGAAPKRESRDLLLRRYRQREMVRIAYRDMAGLADAVEVSRELSGLAEACVLTALDLTRPAPGDVFTENADSLVAVAGGKLGSRQMHYASDLDLLFFYPGPADSGSTAESRAQVQLDLDARIERIVELLAAVTPEGVAYAVDLRLRPEGETGLLARSWESFDEHSRRYMQPWERMAMIRCRVLGASDESRRRWERITAEATYEYPWDAEALESIRHLKRRAEAEKSRETRTDLDFKNGKGGVADLEYLVQFLQLFYGGRDRRVRVPGVAEAVPALREAGALTSAEAQILVDAHAFQRHVENHYQLQEEWALREVSKESPSLVRLARSMGYPGGPAADVRRRFISDWEAHAHEVRRLVSRYFYGSI
jgi:glutamate-ammonia-ligase adenylyltransferase